MLLNAPNLKKQNIHKFNNNRGVAFHCSVIPENKLLVKFNKFNSLNYINYSRLIASHHIHPHPKDDHHIAISFLNQRCSLCEISFYEWHRDDLIFDGQHTIHIFECRRYFKAWSHSFTYNRREVFIYYRIRLRSNAN